MCMYSRYICYNRKEVRKCIEIRNIPPYFYFMLLLSATMLYSVVERYTNVTKRADV